MATVAISITKQTSFRGSQQPFANVYHYEVAGPISPETAEAAIDQLVTFEQPLHATIVTFTQARCWSAGGTPAANQMIFEKPLNVVGTQTDQPDMDRERAILVQWPAGINSLGRPVFLRKWYHTCNNPGTGTFPAAVLGNTQPISDTLRGEIQPLVENVREFLAGGQNFLLSSETGRLAGEPAIVYPWLEHHQLGDEWRT